MKKLLSDSRGIAHVAMVLLVVVVLGGIGFAGYTVMNKNKKGSNAELSQALKEASKECEKEADKDICKFLLNWKENKEYKVTMKNTDEGKTTTSTYESKDDRSHMKSDGEYAFEMIVIGKTTYTYDATDGKWWKQTANDTTDEITSSFDQDFEEPADEGTEAKDETKYVSMGKEACGNLTCFKYEIVDPSSPGDKTFVWFDDKDYQLRRMTTESKDGSSSDQTYEYTGVTISEPSPVKELGPNQVIVPGQSEPMDGPSEAELQQLMEQYGN